LLPDFVRNFLTRSVTRRPLEGEVPSIDLVLGYHKAQQLAAPANIPLASRRNDSPCVKEFREVIGAQLLTDFRENGWRLTSTHDFRFGSFATGGDPAASPAMSAVTPKAEVNSER
jgi:hypothetical protein